MSDLVIAEYSDIVSIADAVRSKTGTTDALTLSGIASGINQIETKSGLPEVTTEDNGKILKVVDGAWQLEIDELEYVKPEMFGAIGDGVTDDTQAIQSAINYANLNNKIVEFTPLKTYFINTVTNYAALRIPSNIKLIGNEATLLAGSNLSQSFLIVNDADGTTGGFSANKNITIESLKFDGDMKIITLIGFAHTENIRIINCTFTRLSGWHMIELSATRNAIIDGCNFIDYFGANATEMVQLDCMVSESAFPAFGLYDNQNCCGIRIINCHFANYNHDTEIYATNSSGIGNHTNVKFYEPHDIIITNNTFENLSVGIKFVCLYGFTISNNTITNCHFGMNLSGGRLANGIINGNKVHGDGVTAAMQGRGINVGSNANTENNQALNVTISNNFVTNFTHYGIALNGSDSLIENNIITDTLGALDSSTGIRSQGRGISMAYQQSNVTCRGNFVRNSNQSDIYSFGVNSSYIHIKDNDVGIVDIWSEYNGTLYFIGNFVTTKVNNIDYANHMNNIIAGTPDNSNMLE